MTNDEFDIKVYNITHQINNQEALFEVISKLIKVQICHQNNVNL
jgi:hypothetical protein